MQTETPKHLLEEVLPSKFKPDKAVGIDIIAQLNLTEPKRRQLDRHNKKSNTKSSSRNPSITDTNNKNR